jgi:hypothetical protein
MHQAGLVSRTLLCDRYLGTRFTGFTGTIVQILPQEDAPVQSLPRYSIYWLYWYKSTCLTKIQILAQNALVQKYEY